MNKLYIGIRGRLLSLVLGITVLMAGAAAVYFIAVAPSVQAYHL